MTDQQYNRIKELSGIFEVWTISKYIPHGSGAIISGLEEIYHQLHPQAGPVHKHCGACVEEFLNTMIRIFEQETILRSKEPIETQKNARKKPN